jgi:hypothetical protein
MPLVEPVTTAVFAVAGEVVGNHRLARLRAFEKFRMLHRYAHILPAGAPVLQHADAREVVVL